jgi:site-specific recombinase XerD
VVYLSDDALFAIKLWLKRRDKSKAFVFYGQGQGHLCYSSGRYLFVKYLKKAGLDQKGYTVHCLRHTFASELLNAGMRLECLQQLLGHQDIEVTRRYARLTDTTREEEYFRAMAVIEKGGINGDY